MNKDSIDPLTGNNYQSEKTMYIRYHGLTEDQADLVMSATTYIERDEIFNNIINKRRN